MPFCVVALLGLRSTRRLACLHDGRILRIHALALVLAGSLLHDVPMLVDGECRVVVSKPVVDAGVGGDTLHRLCVQHVRVAPREVYFVEFAVR